MEPGNRECSGGMGWLGSKRWRSGKRTWERMPACVSEDGHRRRKDTRTKLRELDWDLGGKYGMVECGAAGETGEEVCVLSGSDSAGGTEEQAAAGGSAVQPCPGQALGVGER